MPLIKNYCKFLPFLIIFSYFLIEIVAEPDYEKYGVTDDYIDYLNDTTKIFNQLFKHQNYDPRLSPVYSKMPKNWTTSKQPRFLINCLLAFSKVIDINAQNQIFALMLDLWIQWQDVRLIWNPKDYNDVEYFWINPEMIWMPEHSVGNAKVLQEIYPLNIQQAKLWHNGSVTVVRSYYAEITCNIDVSIFPFDRQLCQVALLSRSYDRNQVEMSAGINPDFPPLTSGNGEWVCKRIEPAIEHGGGDYMIFDMLTFTYDMHRVPNFYIYVIALPCFILTTLSIFGMFWTPNEGEQQIPKLSIGLTSLVSMTVLLQMVSDAIPKTVTFPLLGIFVVIDIIIIAVACVIVVAFTLQQCRNYVKKMEAMKGKDKELSTFMRLIRPLRAPHIICHVFFQILNFINFIVLMSFWGLGDDHSMVVDYGVKMYND